MNPIENSVIIQFNISWKEFVYIAFEVLAYNFTHFCFNPNATEYIHVLTIFSRKTQTTTVRLRHFDWPAVVIRNLRLLFMEKLASDENK